MTSSGLTKRRWVDPIEDFVRQYGHHRDRWAICCTYELNTDLVRRKLLPALTRHGTTFRTIILADAARMEAHSNDGIDRLDCVNIHAVRVAGHKFHPKLVLLRAGTVLRVCYGSANITTGGFGNHLELWSSSDDSAVTGAIVQFLQEVMENQSIMLDSAGKRNLKRALCGLASKRSAHVWTSFEGPFHGWLQRNHGGRIRSATAVSPCYTTSAKLVELKRLWKAGKLSLMTDQNVACRGLEVHTYQPRERADIEPEEEDWPTSLHAKAYLIEHDRMKTLWLGSANFTHNGLAGWAGRNANVELLIGGRSDAVQVQEFRKDLKEVFARYEGKNRLRNPKFVPCTARSPVLGCYIKYTQAGVVLEIETVPRCRRIILEIGGERVLVKVSNCIGQIAPVRLNQLLNKIGLQIKDLPCCFTICQIVDGETLPLLVNVPHQPVVESGVQTFASLDALLVDLRGGLRPASNPREESEGDEEPTEKDVENDESDDQIERRLDEANHQGLLDQLAVKTEAMRRLVARTGADAPHRKALLTEALSTLRVAAPPHVFTVLARWLSKDAVI